MSLARQFRRHALELGAVLFLVVCASAVGAYVLAHQRVRFPWQHVYTIEADFTSARRRSRPARARPSTSRA